MTRTSGELFQAVSSLRKAIETEFTGNSYYLAAQQVTELNELLNGAANGHGAPYGSRMTFSSALENVRKRAETELFDNRFYLFAHKLDVLSFLAAQAIAHVKAVESAPKSLPQSVTSVNATANGNADVKNAYERNFEELAAASKSRVQQSAAALGIQMISPHHDAEGANDGELRRRSSEPCSQRDFTQAVGEMAASGVSSKSFPVPANSQSSPDLGLPPAEIERDAENGGHHCRQTKEEEPAPAFHPAKAENDSPSPATGETLAALKPAGTSWVSRIFGRAKQ